MSKSLFSKTAVAAFALVIGAAGVVGCAKKPIKMDSVSGVITYPQHVKLSPAAVAHVRLADVTNGHVEGTTVVERKVRPNADGTIPFTLVFKEKEINPAHRYAVDVRVVDRDEVMIIGGKKNPVLTRGHGNTVEMELDRGSKF